MTNKNLCRIELAITRILWGAIPLMLLLAAGLPQVALAESPVTRIVADTIGLDAPVVEMTWEEVSANGETKKVWVMPEFAAGRHVDSALPGQGGNIVISGHNNQSGEVFRNLNDLENGDIITLYQGETASRYAVVQKMLLKDRGEPPEVRKANARWVGKINEERLTLVSDWPYAGSTHKVIVVAWPADRPAQPAATATTPLPAPTATPQPTSRPTALPTAARPAVSATATVPLNTLPSLTDDPLVAEVEPPTNVDLPQLEESPGPPISRVVAPAIGLNTSVIPVGWRLMERDGVMKNVWEVADFAAGWHRNSKKPGQGGNIVLSGHHNINGQVFRYLVDLQEGDLITLYRGDEPVYYQVSERVILKDQGEPPEVRRENARWIGPTAEERLTLVTCWPFHSNTHRLIVVAKPAPPPDRPLAIDPFSIEQRPAAFAMDTVPLPGSGPSAAVPAPAPPASPITRITADSIKLDVSVVEEGWKIVDRDGSPKKVWDIPENAAGWHKDSKMPGQGGNVVLSGYHNTRGQVFRYIVDLNPGDIVTLHAGDRAYPYQVVDKLILKDAGEPAEVRRENARWIGPINEERLTLVTGWPYTGNTHRVVVIAHPMF
ncbi:MAG: hypothetical protein Kow0031_07680 [Anaerolineae bacterium]